MGRRRQRKVAGTGRGLGYVLNFRSYVGYSDQITHTKRIK